MIVKQLFFEDDARNKLISGIEKLSKAVGSTMGARGRTVLIESENVIGGVTISKDGVTVAKSINLYDPLENLAVKLVREAAEKTVLAAGDGTTTAVVLTEALIKSAMKEMKEDSNVVAVTREMQRIKDLLINELDTASQKVSGKTLIDVATISANNDKGIGKLIASTYKAVGKNGIVTVENSNNHETYADVIKGMRIDRGFTSNYFINDQKNQQCVLDNPLVLITDSEITNLMSIQRIFAKAIETKRPLLIIAELSQASMATLNMNVAKGIIKACHIVPPNFGFKKQTIMSDLAVALGGTYFSESTGDDLQLITPDDLGTAEKIIITQDTTTIIGKRNEAVKSLLAELNENLKVETRKTEVKFLRERISSLSGSVGVIYVGADSDIEQKEKRDRVDDAVLAVAAAIEQGILPGGGTALMSSFSRLENPRAEVSTGLAMKIMHSAMFAPFERINSNAGIKLEDSDYIICSDGSTGIDVRDGELCNMIESGIIDAAKVTKSALSNAVSVATTILMTDAAITNVRE
jgi:chaperonin GroEL